MELHDLPVTPGSTKTPKRKGQGIGSGNGKTAGRGHKGYGARAGHGKGPAFQGGQMRLTQRLPKRGFHNIFGVDYDLVNVADLEEFDAGTEVGPDQFYVAGMIRRNAIRVKVLGDGEVAKALTVRAHAFSKTAKEKIEAAGGKAEVI